MKEERELGDRGNLFIGSRSEQRFCSQSFIFAIRILPCVSPPRAKSSFRSAMRLKFLILFAVVSLTILPADAQSIDSESGHVPMTTLPGPWRFHAGDDPSWSNTTFDDSSWSQLAAGEPWSQLGKSIGIY